MRAFAHRSNACRRGRRGFARAAAAAIVASLAAASGAQAGATTLSTGCVPASPTRAWHGDRRAPQAFGTTHVGLRALLFLPHQAAWASPARAVFTGLTGTEVKIAWAMVGTGPFTVVAFGPRGQRLRPTWGPSPHSGGNWVHPGGEWGTGWTFPVGGCWRVHATIGHRTGDLWLLLR